ncbi:MAG: chemotaxis protein CheA [Phycisphaerales bacterium]|nr:chemotaxis protein CheA [Planctomycetota bacterium]MCH8507540.1 chemotaxis protein CheA [Phycisphaerales bacterium]
MSIDQFDPEILQDFLTESGELLEQLEGDLVSLEATPADPELLNQIFRALHTIKGSASFLALTNLVEIAHAAETALNAARNGTISVGSSEMDLLLAAVDVLKQQFEELSGGQTDLTKADQNLVEALAGLGDPSRTVAAAIDERPAPAVPAPAAEAGVRTIELDPAKADLIEHLITDVQHNIEQMQLQLDRLCEPGSRSAAGTILSELADDLVKTVDFFEIEECLSLAAALEQAFEGIDSIAEDQLAQVRVRARAVCAVLADQANELSGLKLTNRPTATLVQRLRDAAQGALDSSCFVIPDAEVDDVLSFDGVFGALTAATPPSPAASDPTSDALEASVEPFAAHGTASPDGFAESKPDLTAKVAPGSPDRAQDKSADAAKRQSVPVEQTIRVEVGRLESLMNLVGELVLQKNRIGALTEDVGRAQIDPELIEQLEMTAGTLDRVTGDIQVAVMRTRMQPLEKLFGKYPRLIRDLAAKTDKKIQLIIEGGETEVDKSVIEELGDPLVHLLRNSADHGVEPPAERAAAGKDETGIIRLIAGHEGSHVRVQILDDGRGLNRARIGAKAVERGLCSEEQLTTLSDEEVFRFIFEAGFSTADQVSDLSGRGVGMDVVRTNIERKLKGTITVESEAGRGTTLTITIPLTVAIMPAMMVAVGGDTFAIPLTNITEIVRPTPEMISTIGLSPVIHLRGSVHPLLSAGEVFGCDSGPDTEPFVVVIGFNQKLIGLRVTRVIGQQEIVIKPLDGVKRNGPISGATVRNDGGVSLIMDVAELMRLSRQGHATTAA